IKYAAAKMNQTKTELQVEAMGHQGLGWEGEGFKPGEIMSTRAMLRGITGVELPAFVRDRLQDSPTPGSQAVVAITFAGPHATDPVLAGLAADCGISANIFAGSVDEIAGRPFGRLVVGIDTGRLPEAQAYLVQRGLTSEVLGHVA
ncbi:MAG TPA: NIL domain-containing protein, partial [Paracoccus sp. (in: a-proteobacteria)]|nr:NIL domain-containing protein [Paracoccus sp. (in: a-proteobacteria)]